jgi:hypothetical protein
MLRHYSRPSIVPVKAFSLRINLLGNRSNISLLVELVAQLDDLPGNG